MKKSEFTQLTQIVEILVKREIKKQFPKLLSEMFQTMHDKSVISENIDPVEEEAVDIVDAEDTGINLKQSLREMFAGTPVMKPVEPQVKQFINYTKNPVLNQILNETTPDLRSRERMVGAAAFQGGYNPEVMMSPGEIPSIPIGTPPLLVEGQVSTHAPLDALPEGVSVLDIVKQVPVKSEVKHALTRNYSDMMKLIDKKKGKI